MIGVKNFRSDVILTLTIFFYFKKKKKAEGEKITKLKLNCKY